MPEPIRNPFKALLTPSGSLHYTLRHRIQAQLKFVNIHIFITAAFLRLARGPDQLTYQIRTPNFTLKNFKAQLVIPDQFIRFEPALDVLWLAPNVFEEELSGPPYGRLIPQLGLTEPTQPSSVISNLPDGKLSLTEMRNQTALISYDLATNTREVSESYDR